MNDMSKLSNADLLKMIADLQKQVENKPSGPVSFGPSKNPNIFTFKHGTAGAWPVSTTIAAWRVICANVKLIEKELQGK